MTRINITRAALAGTALTAVLLAGCASTNPMAKAQLRGVAAAQSAGVDMLTEQAAAALARGEAVAAISFAELAVRAEPTAIAPRSQLAKAYFQAGRFTSATQAYDDLIDAGQADAVSFRAALARLANGDTAGALALLQGIEATGNKSDVGLAYALAGDSARAITLLTDAIRAGQADARTRQNLALAQALDGQWAAARVTALQDLAPDQVDARVAEWSRLREQQDSRARVTTLLALTPVATDQGRPAQLAWNAAADAPQLAAVAEPVPVAPMVAPTAAQGDASIVAETSPEPAALTAETVPASVSTFAQAEEVAAAASVPVAPTAAVAEAPTIRVVEVAALLPQPTAETDAPAKTVAPTPASGGWVVQVGAFGRGIDIEKAWGRIAARSDLLTKYQPTRTEVTLPTGKTLQRLSVGAFADKTGAWSVCRDLQREGRDCFVRAASPEAQSLRVAMVRKTARS